MESWVGLVEVLAVDFPREVDREEALGVVQVAVAVAGYPVSRFSSFGLLDYLVPSMLKKKIII